MKGNDKRTLTIDASKLGWSAVLGISSTDGSFTSEETEFYIVLSFTAIFFGLQSLCDHVRDRHLKVLTDNTTAAHSVNNI